MKKSIFLLIILPFLISCSKNDTDRQEESQKSIADSLSELKNDNNADQQQDITKKEDNNKTINTNRIVSSLDESLLTDAIVVNSQFKVPLYYENLYYEGKIDNNIAGGFSEAPNTYCYLKNINIISINNLKEENIKEIDVLRFPNPYIGWKGMYRYKYETLFQNETLHLTILNEIDNYGFISDEYKNETFNPLDNKNYVVYIVTSTFDYRIELISSGEEKVEYNTQYIKKIDLNPK